MIAAAFIAWTVIALVVGIVIGRAIAMADRLAPAVEAPLYVPSEWVA